MMRKKCKLLYGLLIALFSISSVAQALDFPLPPKGSSVVGRSYVVLARPGETLGSIGQQHDIGYYEMLEANPQLKEDFLFVGERVTIPARFILPNAARKGIVINLDELRLYYYPPGKKTVMTFPVGIGREGWSTPLGRMSIIQKKTDPTWYVPESIRQWRAEHGVQLPKIVPPGPDNPLGRHMMRLSQPSYLLHGTNQPSGVGRRTSSGCIRLYPTDIESLYHYVTINTPVNIISEPYKAGWQGNKLYVEAHLPLQEHQTDFANALKSIREVVKKAQANRSAHIDWFIAEQVVKEQIGVPMLIGGTQTTAIEEAQEAFATRFRVLKGFENIPKPVINP